MFHIAFLLIPLALILAASGFLVSKLSKPSSVAVMLIGLTAVVIGIFWVPNPVILWPFSVLGEHTLPELIGELFTFHIVPSPEGSYSSAASFQPLFRWQLMECGARMCVLVTGWTACLVAIWTIGTRGRAAQTLDGMPSSAAQPLDTTTSDDLNKTTYRDASGRTQGDSSDS